jgi:hypothetical protein
MTGKDIPEQTDKKTTLKPETNLTETVCGTHAVVPL